MILPDVNVLVYAFRREAEGHDVYAAWLDGARRGTERVALVETVLAGFIRVVSNPRVFADPAPTPVALDFVEALRASPAATPLGSTSAAWDRLRVLADGDRLVRGNFVPDAWLAALALTSGARIATSDAGFARFPGLDWFDPAA